MGSSSKADTSESECQVPVISGKGDGMGDTTVTEMEFRPLEHPVEPPSDEDQPVKCPMCVSPAVKVGEMPKEHLTETPVKRMESADTTRDRGAVAKEDSESLRARKRHHNQTHRDIAMAPSLVAVPPPDSAHKLTVPQHMNSNKP